jgi:hypothetical protein
MQNPVRLFVTCVYLVIVISFLLVSLAFDSHWLEECANSTPTYSTIDQSYAAWNFVRHQRNATHVLSLRNDTLLVTRYGCQKKAGRRKPLA